MITDELLDQLRYRGEGAGLDFKQSQYRFAKAGDHEKAELLKDIVAMANAHRDGSGYILIGFQECNPEPARVVGISAGDHIDDAALQEFVHSKVEPVLSFRYDELIFEGQHVAAITVPKQSRPFALTRDYGPLRKRVVYVRRGSSTGEASMTEVAQMVRADLGASGKPDLALRIEDEGNHPLVEEYALAFFEFDEFPDYWESETYFVNDHIRISRPTMRFVNREFYRESAEYLAATRSKITVRLSLVNQSTFSLSEAKLEIEFKSLGGETTSMRRVDDLPDEPEASSQFFPMHKRVGSARERAGVVVNRRGHTPVCNVHLGTLRPGETAHSDTDIALLPSGPGDNVLTIRILAKEIDEPIVRVHRLNLSGPVTKIDLAALEKMICEAQVRHV